MTAVRDREFVGAGGTLYRWLGTFWTRLYRDHEFLKGLQNARSLLAAQTYLDVLEKLALTDRNNVPVFHRRRWHPVVVRVRDRGLGDAVGVRFDSGLKFDSGLTYGGTFTEPGFVSYPVAGISGIRTCIVNDIVNPTKLLVPGTDFVYRDNTILLRESDDPFQSRDFAVYGDADDAEAVLWACDAETDADFVNRGLGYAMGIRASSSETSAKIINAIWDIVSGGCTPALLSSLLCAVYGLPAAASDETVETVADDGTVVTDAGVYATDPLYRTLSEGDRVSRGTPMDARLRLFRFPFDVNDPDLRTLVPSLRIPATLLQGADTGTTLSWDETPVYDAGLDANGNTRIRFRVFRNTDDDDRFWNMMWSRCEASGIDCYDCFSGHVDDIVLDGESGVVGRISPLAWYLDKIAGPGTIIAWVRPRTASGLAVDLRRTLPVTVRLIIIEASSVSEDTSDTDYAEESVSAADAAVVTDTASEAGDHLLSRKWVIA